MNGLLKSCLLRNNRFFASILAVLCWLQVCGQQFANYVNNGSFENYFTSVIHHIPYYWGATDSIQYFGGLLIPPNQVPLSNYAFQWPHQGKNYFIFSPYSQFSYNNRGYPRNRLKQTLKAGKSYCVSFYVNLSNQSTYGIDAIGAYFGNSSLDTIKSCTWPITYLTPQISNSSNNVITDTLNWVPITGTFVANGTEKYMIIGNFKSDVSTNSTMVRQTNPQVVASEYLIDDVKCIEMDAPAYAGPDKLIKYGDSVYIGQDSDYAIDPYCQWYQLPGMVPLDTTSGIWVKPSVTTTYVVKQNIECGSEKVDTVVISVNYVGLNELAHDGGVKFFPNPASSTLYLETFGDPGSGIMCTVFDQLGQIVKEEELVFNDRKASINLEALSNGAYFITIKNSDNEKVTKKLLIAK